MSDDDIVRRRLSNQCLRGPLPDIPQDVVGRLVAVQAQDPGQAKWSIGRRVTRATEAQLDRAYADGAILRTHVLRPTWHFVRPQDIRMLLAATAPRVRARMASRLRQLGLDDAALERSRALLAAALRGGRHVTRAEAAAVLSEGGVGVAGQRLPHILMDAELHALICSGFPRGKQHTWALLDERAPGARVVSRARAVAELARRYFISHGPATAKDLAAWATLTMSDVRTGIAAAGARLRREEVGGLAYWSAASDSGGAGPGDPAAIGPTVHLLQGYDEYVMGYRETRHLMARPGSSWSPSTPPVFSLVMLIDGRMAGTWRRRTVRGRVLVEVASHQPLDVGQRQALEDEAARYGEYLGVAISVQVRPAEK